jgi:hypothetical protein
MSDLAQQAGISDSAKEAAERDSRWIGEFADELNVAIALELVEQGAFLLLAIGFSHVSTGQAKLAPMPLLAAKLTPLRALAHLCSITSAFLPTDHKEADKKLIALLIRLDAHGGLVLRDLQGERSCER